MANWFIGLPVSAGAWLETLPPLPRGFRRFGAGDLHLTVAFLGSLPEAAARAAWDALRWPHAARDVTLGAVVPMGNARRYSALSALLMEGRVEIEAGIAGARTAAWAASGARPDHRPAKAHLTVARPQRNVSDGERRAGLAWAAMVTPPPAPLRIDRVALYTWSADRATSLFRVAEETTLPKDR